MKTHFTPVQIQFKYSNQSTHPSTFVLSTSIALRFLLLGLFFMENGTHTHTHKLLIWLANERANSHPIIYLQ